MILLIVDRLIIQILEIMDRSIGPYNGIKIGDVCTIEKDFFLKVSSLN